MGKGKLEKFREMETFANVFQYPFSVVDEVPFAMKGKWHEQYFKNNHPIVLELGCGKGCAGNQNGRPSLAYAAHTVHHGNQPEGYDD